MSTTTIATVVVATVEQKSSTHIVAMDTVTECVVAVMTSFIAETVLY